MSFVRLTDAEQDFLTQEKMQILFKKFFAKSEIVAKVASFGGDFNKIETFFSQLQVELGEIFG